MPVLDLLNGFLGAPNAAATTGIHGPVTAGGINTTTGTAGLTDMFTEQTTQNNLNSTAPRAFINVVFFDDQFKVCGYRVSMVGTNSTVKDHYSDLQKIAAPKNGFVYIYCSNETPVDVFFDNLQVVHTRSPILEETHYYPFGLTMSGISSKAAGGMVNKDKTFQGQKFDNDFGINYVEFKYRNHDVQTGRFIEIDPLSNKYVYNSTYAFSENKVTGHVELEGLEAVETADKNKTDYSSSKTYFPNTSSPGLHLGAASIKAAKVRVQYNEAVAKLDVADKQGRLALKESARANTPEPFNTVVESSRPIAGEQAKANDPAFKGNAIKTNVEVNETMVTTGVIGKVVVGAGIVQSSYTIATSPTPVQEAVTESAGWGMAMYGGATGAVAWAPGGPIASAAGSVVGSTMGYFFGKQGSQAVLNAAPEIKAVIRDYKAQTTAEGCTICGLDH